MDVYTTEEEQVQAIKQWWKDNYLSIFGGVFAAVFLIGGYKYWIESQQSKAQQASVIFSDILLSGNRKEKNTVKLQSDYSSTPYAALAVLLSAKDNVTENKIDNAILQLQWVVDNNNSDGIEHIARQRLARLYLSQSRIDLAESIIQGFKAMGFASSYSEIRGDINLAKKLPAQAQENYRLALSSITPQHSRYTILKMKLDDLTQAKKIMKTDNEIEGIVK